ncbi:hypothetical protein V5O48_017632 [Marasmius crinis-equi]|uniref:Uncharacterized protein n=1 Tax=Marasmius crinis-equi TaxID=585013 RepID=A0ABR3ENG2_9AGAR
MSPETTFIWIRIRKSCKAPDPFPGVSEIEWVNLLFGSSRCQFCGHKGVLRIEFLLHKRICYACVKLHGVSKGRFKQAFPGRDKWILDLVLPTSGGHQTGHTRYYNKREIELVLQRVEACRGKAELQEYVKKRREHLDKLIEHQRLCSQWTYSDRRSQELDAQNVQEARYQAVKSHLEAMGFTPDDLETVKHHELVSKDKPLTSAAWARIKKEVVAFVREVRIRRLLRSKDELPFVASRCDLISQCFYAFKHALGPAEWLQLPSIEGIWQLPSMRQIVGLPDDVAVPEQGLVTVATVRLAEEIGNLIGRIKESVEVKYTWLADGRGVPLVFRFWLGTGGSEKAAAHEVPSFDKHYIWRGPATVQARCNLCRQVCTSASALLRHITGPCSLLSDKYQELQDIDWDPSDCYLFALFRSSTATGLVHASGLDLFTATADEMDERGRFFVCTRCVPPTKPAFEGTWRECIMHAFEVRSSYDWFPLHENTYDPAVENPVFEMIDEGNGEEGWPPRKDQRKCWSCSHCSANIEELWTRETVVGHLKDVHNISEAHVPKDFFYAAVDERSANQLEQDSDASTP